MSDHDLSSDSYDDELCSSDFYEEESDHLSQDEGFLEDDDLGFKDALLDEKRKKSYQVDFVIHQLSEIAEFQQKEAEHVANIIHIAPQHAATLLRYCHWNKEVLLEKYMDNPEQLLTAACVIVDTNSAPKISKMKGFVCDICCDDDPNLNTLALSCLHRFCVQCYRHYLIQKIQEEGESRRITCMGQCSLIVDASTVKSLVPTHIFEKYQNLLLRTYVDDSEFFRWCPAPNCGYAIECRLPRPKAELLAPEVTCACKFTFCFGCGQAPHTPCICRLAKLWLRKCQDDSETANWISANTKECPKCQSTIEKNGGCNHMTCRKCLYEWCWMCSGPWSEHGQNWYNCNRYSEDSSAQARDTQAKSRSQLERYLHYYNRYANHGQSAKLSQELYLKTEKNMEAMQKESSLSWIEVQFLKRALDITVECRMTLKWTYAFAFYLDRNHMTTLFEDNQRDLEMAVEQLNELLETPLQKEHIPELRQKVLNKSVYVQHRREIMLEDTSRGLIEGRWTWTEAVPSL